jgi:hypothetical protein
MAFQVSPGVNVSEIDLTTIVPGTSASVGAIAGVFNWGPVDRALLVDSEASLITRYGKPTNQNPETFFSAASFLAYSNALYVSRAANFETTDIVVAAVTTDASNTTIVAIGNTAIGSVAAGWLVFGPGIPEGTLVSSTEVDGSDTNIVLSKAATADGTNKSIAFVPNTQSTSAVANTGAVVLTDSTVKNDEHYETITFDSDVQWVARYPGSLGNSLKISVCDSADAFTSVIDPSEFDDSEAASTVSITFTVNSNTATLTCEAGESGVGNAVSMVAESVALLTIGDFVKVGNSSIGYQYLKLTAIADSTGDADESAVVLSFSEKYQLAATITSTTIERYWQYWNVVDASPDASQYVLENGAIGQKDELHIVVVDEKGKFTGVPGTILEVFEGLSRATDAKSVDGDDIYYKNVINSSSRYVRWANDRSGAGSETALNIVTATTTVPYNQTFIGGCDGSDENSIALGKVINAYNLYRNGEEYDVSLILTGKSRGGAGGEQLANYLIDNIAEYRKDCVVFLSPDKSDVVNNTSFDEDADVVAFRDNIRSSSYAVLDSGYKYMYDRYNDVYRWIPLNGDVAGLCARTDETNDSWWSPAGLNRGQIKNIIKLAWNPGKAARDVLYKKGINPVVSFAGQGTVLYGDKTLLAKPSAFDRINVRRLFITLEKAIAAFSKFVLFEFNDDFTRRQFVSTVEPYLRTVQSRRGITDFRVICDSTNNTGEVIDRNEFVGDIYIKPARSINFIQLNFVAVRTGVEFSEVVLTGTNLTSIG